MLKARNLDDQTYQEIVKAAEGRLPWLCPSWTDHNAHDPGITILELMAWYKELQQYQMNQFTDELRCKLLKLAGVRRRPAVPAGCAVELYATTLHYAPCSLVQEGFQVAIILVKGTNEAMPEVTGAIAEDRLMTARNKWLIAHEESGLGADGAFVGLTGKNLKTNI